MSQHGEVTIEEGSTNVYADLGYADAAEMQRKSQLAGEIARAIRARRLSTELPQGVRRCALLHMPACQMLKRPLRRRVGRFGARSMPGRCWRTASMAAALSET